MQKERNHEKTHENGHENIFGSDYQYESTIAQFIRRLGLERFSNQYHKYFRVYDFENCKDFVDKIILSYGEDLSWNLSDEEVTWSQEDCTSTLGKEVL